MAPVMTCAAVGCGVWTDETAAIAKYGSMWRCRKHAKAQDAVNRPPHYTSHPSGVECIVVTEHMNFCLGNAMKYIWRADSKGNAVEDLEKARWYLDREIARRKAGK